MFLLILPLIALYAVLIASRLSLPLTATDSPILTPAAYTLPLTLPHWHAAYRFILPLASLRLSPHAASRMLPHAASRLSIAPSLTLPLIALYAASRLIALYRATLLPHAASCLTLPLIASCLIALYLATER